MKKKTIKLLIGFIITVAVLISVGCKGDPSQNNDTNSNNEANIPANSTPDPSTPEDKKVVEAIREKMRSDPNLRDQVKNIDITYAKRTLTLKGHIYGNDNLLTFYKILFDAIEEDVSQKIKADMSRSQMDSSNPENKDIPRINSIGFEVFLDRMQGDCQGGCECGIACVPCGHC